MKIGDNHILTNLKRITLILGILVGFCALSVNNQLSYSGAQQVEESTEEDAAGSELILKVIDAINYSSQINVNHHPNLVAEIPEVESETEDTLESSPVVTRLSKAFKILFRRIISPNAP